MKRATFDTMKKHLDTAISDMAILSGEVVGPSGATWQDVAGTAVVHLRLLADQLEQARLGNAEPALVFPSPVDSVDAI